MDFRTFRKKLIKNGFSKWASIVLLSLTILFITLGIVMNLSGKKDALLLRDHRDEEGAYAYLDVAAFDEWVCTYSDETYYVLYESSGEAYLAVVSDSVMKRMEKNSYPVGEYTRRFREDYRLYGLVKKVSYTVFGYVEDVYGISEDQYVQIFGKCYLNTTENPNTNTAWMWWTFSIFTGIFGLVFAVIWLGSELPFRKESCDFTEEEYAEAARLLDGADKKQRIIFGDDLIICRSPAMLMRYRDIVWMHYVDTYYYGANLGRSVRVCSHRRNEFKIYPTVKNSEPELREIMNRIYEKNPDIIVGYTKENRKLYDSLTRKRS